MDEFKKNIEKFLPYVEDLRRRLYRVVILFFVILMGSFFFTSTILQRILSLLHIDQVTISTSSPFQFFDVMIDVGFFAATIVCVPYILYTLYRFVAPALTKKERKEVLRSVPISIVLFILGFSYGFFTLYYALGLLAKMNISIGVANFWNLSQFITEILFTSTVLGLIFQYPIVLTLLIKFGIISSQTLKEKRLIAYCIMALFVGLLPPPEVTATIMEALPLVVLYEMTILAN